MDYADIMENLILIPLAGEVADLLARDWNVTLNLILRDYNTAVDETHLKRELWPNPHFQK